MPSTQAGPSEESSKSVRPQAQVRDRVLLYVRVPVKVEREAVRDRAVPSSMRWPNRAHKRGG